MPKPQVGDKTTVKFKIQGNDYSAEEGKIVKVEESEDKSAWRLKVKTASGTYTVNRSKK